MTTPRIAKFRTAWWIALAVLLAPALYLCYWLRQLAQVQTPRLDTLALSYAENPDMWEGITLGGQHPMQVYQDMRYANEYVLVASTLAATLLIAAGILLTLGWLATRTRKAND